MGVRAPLSAVNSSGTSSTRFSFSKRARFWLMPSTISFIERLHFWIRNQFGAGEKGISFSRAHCFQQGEVRGDQNGGEFALVAEDGGDSDQRIQLQRILDRLRRDEFSAGGLDQVFLAIGDGEISIGVDVADVAGLEPAIRPSAALVSSGRFQ